MPTSIISDKDLDLMTRATVGMDVDAWNPEIMDASPRTDKERAFIGMDVDAESPGNMNAGISAMQEQSFDNIEGAQELIANIRTGLNDPARAMSEGATEEDVAMVQSMTDSQLLEFVTEMGTHAETEGMGEESAEDKAIRLVTGQEGRSMSDSDMDWRERLNQLGDPEDINFSPTGMNRGGPVKYYNRGGLASMGRGGDSQLAHVMPGETMVPPGVMDDGMLDAAFVRAGLDPNQYKVGSPQASTNPRTGMPEYGLGSFFSRLWKKVKKLAPAIGTLVGFRYGGAQGAGIGKAIGGVIKTGDLDFQKALSDFGTGWTLGNVATGMGMQQGPLFKKGTHIIEQGDTITSIAGEYGVAEQDIIDANPNISTGSSITMGVGDAIKIPGKGMWGLSPTPGQGGTGGFIQDIGARIAGGKNIDLMDEFKNLPMKHKLAVGALGLNALSQTGMFDEEELGDTPPEMRQGIAELRDYHSQPLRAANQVEYSFDPSLGQPIGVTEYSNQNKSLKQLLEEIGSDSIGYQPSTISYG